MKMKYIAGMLLCLAALVCLAVCLFTDWNDGLFLPLALCLAAAGNLINILRLGKEKKENGK
ncbi:MAG: hypothetical protein MR426_06240 [Clostridiales bacterium]|nr:hypothetical protein [Clostridiales bacterium]